MPIDDESHLVLSGGISRSHTMLEELWNTALSNIFLISSGIYYGIVDKFNTFLFQNLPRFNHGREQYLNEATKLTLLEFIWWESLDLEWLQRMLWRFSV